MAATGYTPISLYYSTTASAAPSGANLVAGELALNTLDEKLYFKNSTGTVKVLASTASTGTVTSVAASVPAFLSIAGSPITTSGTLAITYSGTALPVANGGTGLTSGTSGGVLYYSATGTLASSGALTQYGVVYGGGAGATPVATANGTTGQAFIATTSAAPSWGTLGIAGGGTGLTTTPANGALDIGNGTGFTRTTLTAGTGITVTNGAGSITIASTAGASGLTLISTLTASNSASLAWTGLSGYTSYIMIVEDILLATAGALYLQQGTGATPTWITSSYYTQASSNQNATVNNLTGGAGINIDASAAGTITPINSFVYISQISGGYFQASSYGNLNNYLGGTLKNLYCTGTSFNSTATTAIRLISASGNLTSGKASLYGLAP